MAAAEHRCAINHLHTDKKTSCTSHFDYFHLTLARRPVCECVETSSFISLVYKCIKKKQIPGASLRRSPPPFSVLLAPKERDDARPRNIEMSQL